MTKAFKATIGGTVLLVSATLCGDEKPDAEREPVTRSILDVSNIQTLIDGSIANGLVQNLNIQNGGYGLDPAWKQALDREGKYAYYFARLHDDRLVTLVTL